MSVETASTRPSPISRVAAVLASPHFSPYKTYVRRDRGLVVLLNPKVGSTMFRKVLVEGLRNVGGRPFLGAWWPLNVTRRYMTAPLADYWNAFAHPERYRFYCFVRNPYARLLSAWNDKMVKGHASDQYPRSMRPLVPRIRRFAASNGLAGSEPGSVIPFSTFVSYVESKPEGRRNQHWDTQRSVLLADLVDYHRVYRMETDLVVGTTEILTQLGIPEEWVVEKLQKPENASGRVRERVYDEGLAERVHRLYAVDFERFGYDLESWREL
jgi:hypothetical protein